jgi:hypothetical protein
VASNRDDGDGNEHETFGPIDPGTLYRIRKTFVRHEPLVESAEIDSPARPTALSIALSARFDAPRRFDVRWSRYECYGFHYEELADGPAFRFDRHPNPHFPEKHFHPPPTASRDAAEPSCIAVTLPNLVTLAVVEAWRHALDGADVSLVNRLDDPP